MRYCIFMCCFLRRVTHRLVMTMPMPLDRIELHSHCCTYILRNACQINHSLRPCTMSVLCDLQVIVLHGSSP